MSRLLMASVISSSSNEMRIFYLTLHRPHRSDNLRITLAERAVTMNTMKPILRKISKLYIHSALSRRQPKS